MNWNREPERGHVSRNRESEHGRVDWDRKTTQDCVKRGLGCWQESPLGLAVPGNNHRRLDLDRGSPCWQVPRLDPSPLERNNPQ